MVTLARSTSSELPNLGASERTIGLVAGALLVVAGLRRRGPGGLVLALLGGGIAWSGAQRRSALFDRLGLRRFAGARGRANAVRGRGVRLVRTVTIGRPPDQVYRFWRRFENLPRFMENLLEVRPMGPRLYRWVARAPLGTVEWDAEILEEHPPHMISWRSVPGSSVQNAGSVHFRPVDAGRGTEVRVELAYKPPAGPLGVVVARATGKEPSLQVHEDLQRFKQVLEAGQPPQGQTRPRF